MILHMLSMLVIPFLPGIHDTSFFITSHGSAIERKNRISMKDMMESELSISIPGIPIRMSSGPGHSAKKGRQTLPYLIKEGAAALCDATAQSFACGSKATLLSTFYLTSRSWSAHMSNIL